MKKSKFKEELGLIFEKFPFFSEFSRVIKAYIYFGNNKFLVSTPKWSNVYQQVFRKLFSCIFITISIFILSKLFSSLPKAGKVNDIILSIFPDLLGFAIGIYALVHVLPLSKYEQIKKDYNSGCSKVLPTSLNSDLAYPILAMLTVLFLSVIFEFMPHNQTTIFINLFLLIYGMAMIFELVYSIFIFTQHHLTTLTNDNKDEDKNSNTKL